MAWISFIPFTPEKEDCAGLKGTERAKPKKGTDTFFSGQMVKKVSVPFPVHHGGALF
jgi:hypothetical protein